MYDKKLPKLHEVLAAESTVKNQANKIVLETNKVFANKQSHFDGMSKVYTSSIEGGEQLHGESKQMVTTVDAKLEHLFKFITESLIVTATKEETNSSGNARAILVIGDTEVGTYAATTLLAMEGVFTKLRETLLLIPTLDMTADWTKYNEEDKHALPDEVRTQMSQKDSFHVTVQATEHFPAQVNKLVEKFKIGDWTVKQWSGKMTPTNKAKIIYRIDYLIKEVKAARSRANNVEIIPALGLDQIFDFILKG